MGTDLENVLEELNKLKWLFEYFAECKSVGNIKDEITKKFDELKVLAGKINEGGIVVQKCIECGKDIDFVYTADEIHVCSEECMEKHLKDCEEEE